MADYKIRMRAKFKDGITTVKALLKHPMETGRRKDKDGKLIAAHFIQHIVGQHKEQVVFDAYWGTGVSANPFVAFSFKGAQKGDDITVRWTDNLGNSGKSTKKIK